VDPKRDPIHLGKTFAVVLRRQSHDVTIIDPKRLRSAESSGAHIEAGVGVIVVEAMKMQNEMKAPKAGLVVSMNVEEGATVSAGDVLAVIE
jgi:multidrug efflux pump subunit AcrA (membrane-fusion protein)